MSSSQAAPTPAAETVEQLDDAVADVLRAWKAGEDVSTGVLPPDFKVVARACRWISALFREIQAQQSAWLMPHVAASPNGEIVFEWRKDAYLLTIYITAQTIEFVQAWGIDMETEMLEGDADTPAARQRLWSWLMQG